MTFGIRVLMATQPLRSRSGFRITLTAELVRSLRFEAYPVGVDSAGNLETISPPQSMLDWSLRDAELPGFGIRLTKAGSRSFFVQTRPPNQRASKRLALPQEHLRDARKEAKTWLAAIAQGVDPRRALINKLDAQAEEKVMAKKTFGMLLNSYARIESVMTEASVSTLSRTDRRRVILEELEGTSGVLGIKPATLRDRRYAANWMSKEPLSAVPVHHLQAEDVQATFGPMFAACADAKKQKEKGVDEPRRRGLGPHQDLATAHKLLRHCSAAWNASPQTRGLDSPFARWRHSRSKLPKVSRREGVLSTDTATGNAWLRALVELLNEDDFATRQLATYVLCLLLWGGRKTEVQKMQWRDIDLEANVLTFRGENTKSGNALHLPLAPWARALLETHRAKLGLEGRPTTAQSWVWPSMRGETSIVEIRPLLERLHAQTGVYLNAHDLRRTVATDILGDTNDLGTVGIALGHSESVTAGYIQRRVAILRPVFVAREARLRREAGLDAPAATGLTTTQMMVLRTARGMMREAGIDTSILESVEI